LGGFLYCQPCLKAVEAVNAAVRADGRGLCEALSGLGLRLGRGEERRCLEELLAVRANRSRAEGEDMELWMEDIQEAVEITQARAGNSKNAALVKAVLGIRIRRIRMFLGLLDPDPLVGGMDPDPDPSLFS
jgi:hypothetical protein